MLRSRWSSGTTLKTPIRIASWAGFYWATTVLTLPMSLNNARTVQKLETGGSPKPSVIRVGTAMIRLQIIAPQPLAPSESHIPSPLPGATFHAQMCPLSLESPSRPSTGPESEPALFGAIRVDIGPLHEQAQPVAQPEPAAAHALRLRDEDLCR